jgi:hypothetical protein
MMDKIGKLTKGDTLHLKNAMLLGLKIETGVLPISQREMRDILTLLEGVDVRDKRIVEVLGNLIVAVKPLEKFIKIMIENKGDAELLVTARKEAEAILEGKDAT